MQTHFTPEQLADPRIAEADKILRSCVHCGFCTATCPTYLIQGDERDSPRGRIYLIKDMFEGAKPASGEVGFHIDRCLSCLSCMTTCPSGVDYMHLVDLARAHVEETGKRTATAKLMRSMIARTVPYPWRFRLALLSAVLMKPFVRLIERMGSQELAAMVRLARRPRFGRLPSSRRRAVPPDGTPDGESGLKGRVLLLAGCAQPVLRPETNSATVRLLERFGYEVVVPSAAGCCGALTSHMGREASGRAFARRNVDVWTRAMQDAPVEAVIINASGCGTTVKDYGHMMANEDPMIAAQAQRIADMTFDITEFLARADVGAPDRWSSLRVAYHSACSMQHGQRISDPPRQLLKKAGFAIVEIPEGHICCGSAGTYNMLQPELSAELRDRKIGNINKVAPDLIATGNIGCIAQLQAGTDIPVVHTVELLDWAYGGPCPNGLSAFRDRISDVPLDSAPTVASA